MGLKLLVWPVCTFTLTLLVVLTTCAWSDPQGLDQLAKNQNVRGVGAKSCQDFLDEKSRVVKGKNFTFGDWLDGYLTAYSENDPSSRIIDTKGQKVLLWWIGRHCAQKPGESFLDAVKAMMNELKPSSAPHALNPKES